MTDWLIIPPEQLSPEALQGLLEEFVTREGTDYGENEFSLNEKVNHVRAQLRGGSAKIAFDPRSETCTIVSCDDLKSNGSIS